MKATRNRLFIDEKSSVNEREKTIYLAVENGCNTLVFSLNDRFFKNENKNHKYVKLITNNAIFVEAGGHNFPLFLPESLFLFQSGLFRMEQGKRKSKHHFCPTNPKTISIVTENARKLFSRVMDIVTIPRIFHMLPDKGYEELWCACPACRAFSPAEQYLIAVNTAADVLAKLDNEARIMYIDFDREPDAEGISPRKNLIKA